MVAALGLLATVAGAWLGDRAGVTAWWLGVGAAWWAALALLGWRERPGLATLSALLAFAALGAALERHDVHVVAPG